MEWGGGEEPKFWMDPSIGLWIGVEMMNGGTQILDGSMDTSWSIFGVMEWGGAEEPKFRMDPTRFFGQFLGWWGGVEVMEEEPKFWVDLWTHHGRFLGLWSGGEVRNPNFGWIHP